MEISASGEERAAREGRIWRRRGKSAEEDTMRDKEESGRNCKIGTDLREGMEGRFLAAGGAAARVDLWRLQG